MLKIKSNINLNELLKLGYKFDSKRYSSQPIYHNGIIAIGVIDRKITSLNYIECTDEGKYQDSLYELITRKMVDMNGGDKE